MSSSLTGRLAATFSSVQDGHVGEGGNITTWTLPPGTGPTQRFEGPWFSTQLTLALSIGVTSFLVFCFLRTRWEVVYMGRTKLKDFSPAPAHSTDLHANGNSRFFGWIIPTLRTSDFTVLQTVGLDAAVLLNFYRMAFMLFSLCAILATIVLMPLNLFRTGSTDSQPEIPGNSTSLLSGHHGRSRGNNTESPTFTDILSDPQTSSTVNLIFTYLFTALTLTFLHKNFHRFVQTRQSFALHLIHSISSRTVLVTSLPQHLRGDRALADYFENCGWTVESVSVVREVEALRKLLEKRTHALLKLENAWAEWVGNPAKDVQGYTPNVYAAKKSITGNVTASPRQAVEPLIAGFDGEDENISNGQAAWNGNGQSGSSVNLDDPESLPLSHVHIHTTRPRPTIRPRALGNKVDAIEYWEKEFRATDEQVKELRKKGRFEATHAAFVTFEDVRSAQMACQVVHYPHHSQVTTEVAPEPRDVVWSRVAMSVRETQIRDIIVVGLFTLLLLSWLAPVTVLSTLLSYEEIKKLMPWLARLIDGSPRLAAIVQNSFPSTAVIIYNSVIPFVLEWLSYQQGYKSRSATEYALMRKYYLVLVTSVLLIFLIASTYWALARELADAPVKIPEKLALSLQKKTARNFMVSYVMLQALGMMPFQLLNLGPLFSLGWARAVGTKTPRDYAEANAPPMLNYGWVYPQGLLIFTICIVYSVVTPLVLIFGAIYFGTAYLVYKYKLLFIYFKPYESNGEAWRITFHRLLWALVTFQLFMTGLFLLQQQKDRQYWLPIAMLPLIVYTIWWSWVMFNDFRGLSRFLAISSICEVQRGERADSVVGVTESATRSQSNLNNRRYAVNDETLYVAPSDKRTDYSQPPMNNFYYGVLNTGRRRYAHPALSGSLPTPWLPGVARPRAFGDGAKERRGVVLSLRRKKGKRLRLSQNPDENPDEQQGSEDIPQDWARGESLSGNSRERERGRSRSSSVSGSGRSGLAASQLSTSSSANPWRDPAPSNSYDRDSARRLRQQPSYDHASGVIALPDEDEVNVWEDEDQVSSEDDEDEEGGRGVGEPRSPSTYFHHPERRRGVPGAALDDGDSNQAAGGGVGL